MGFSCLIILYILLISFIMGPFLLTTLNCRREVLSGKSGSPCCVSFVWSYWRHGRRSHRTVSRYVGNRFKVVWLSLIRTISLGRSQGPLSPSLEEVWKNNLGTKFTRSNTRLTWRFSRYCFGPYLNRCFGNMWHTNSAYFPIGLEMQSGKCIWHFFF